MIRLVTRKEQVKKADKDELLLELCKQVNKQQKELDLLKKENGVLKQAAKNTEKIIRTLKAKCHTLETNLNTVTNYLRKLK